MSTMASVYSTFNRALKGAQREQARYSCAPSMNYLNVILLSASSFLVLSCGARSGLREPRADVLIVDNDAGFLDCRPNPRTICDDRSECTTDSCNAQGLCEHQPIVCDDQDPCTTNSCNPSTGCVFTVTECGGCADGVREAFRDRTRYPNIAGCAGGFALPGLARETAPTCANAAGNNGPNPNGDGCSASDLCAPGFHVCRSSADVAQHSSDGCVGANDAAPSTFWASRQTGTGCLECATGNELGCTSSDCRPGCAPTTETANDLFGCGSLGSVPRESCAPLDRSSNDLCTALVAPWTCNANNPGANVRESEFVRKPGPGAGGVLCCRD